MCNVKPLTNLSAEPIYLTLRPKFKTPHDCASCETLTWVCLTEWYLKLRKRKPIAVFAPVRFYEIREAT